MKKFLLTLLLLIIVTLPMGESTPAYNPDGSPKSDLQLIYVGISSKNAFKLSSVRGGSSLNLYLSSKPGSVFRLQGTQYKVIEVSQDYLKLEVSD